ncbi:MBL fold metallo-hydrolase [Corallococcus sp. ZKHCc1 1396]|uniref:MBL fold metallo-hydrolase n=1 Tax=Corallococcus soli TaxID=2710757 RepID=A0ABR9PGU0_9BACT|nr:MBL fold metallo-hydrolase [Corallococcus soli]MBE4747132.1 MBL fold metallo-hydrolase [Corallococcus soli]
MLTLEMLPAGCGDCLLLEHVHEGRTQRILIDGGTPASYPALRARLSRDARPHFDLIVVTHVDADHIGGILELLRDPAVGTTYDDLWFNGQHHMKSFLAEATGAEGGSAGPEVPPEDRLGPGQGEALATIIRGGRWNEAFRRGPIVVPDTGALPRIELRNGLSLTVLSPTPTALRRMALVWAREVRSVEEELSRPHMATQEQADRLGGTLDVGALSAEPQQRDDAPANGSSIALLAECGPHACLLAADAWPQVLAATLQRLLQERGLSRLPLSAVKLPHHGSKRNVTREWLDLVECSDFLISTDGTRFRHPDAQAIARIVSAKRGVRLHFNTASVPASQWKSESLQVRHGFTTTYPASEGGSRVLTWG